MIHPYSVPAQSHGGLLEPLPAVRVRRQGKNPGQITSSLQSNIGDRQPFTLMYTLADYLKLPIQFTCMTVGGSLANLQKTHADKRRACKLKLESNP